MFTPKRLGRDFEKDRSFAKLRRVGRRGTDARASTALVVAHNELLERKPGLLNTDPYGEGWMLVVRPSHENWRAGLVTGAAIAPAFEALVREPRRLQGSHRIADVLSRRCTLTSCSSAAGTPMCMCSRHSRSCLSRASGSPLVTRDLETPYSGMLPGVVAGLYSVDEAHIDLVRLCAATGARLIHAEANGIDRLEEASSTRRPAADRLRSPCQSTLVSRPHCPQSKAQPSVRPR